MIYEIPALSLSTKLITAFWVVLLPFALTAGSEFFFAKKISWHITGFIFLVCLLIYMTGTLQLKSSKAELSTEFLSIKSLFYSKKLPLSEISTLTLYNDNLPTSLALSIRTNGIGIPSYHAGNFRLRNKDKAFVMMSRPPYIVVTVKENHSKVIFSANQSFFEELSSLINSDKNQPSELKPVLKE